MAKEIAELGFSHMELSHGIRVTLVPGILKAVEQGLIKVSSCHNFCPLPAGVSQPSPNLFQPTAQEPRELDQWLRNTKRSLDFASQVGAGVLVCHLGSVSYFWFNPEEKLEKYMESSSLEDFRQDEAYLKLKTQACEKMRSRMPKFWDAMIGSVKGVLEYASKKGVVLGFENREAFNELPMDDCFDRLFEALPAGAPVGYWHDAGHADIKEKMGLLDHKSHLEHLQGRLIGCHLHDVSSGGRDHQPIGSGRIDFEMISQFWRPEHRLIMEFSPRLTTEQVVASKTRVDDLLAKRFPS